jgi:hypothetical protein
MISGVSAASNAVRSAVAAFDRAAGAVVASVDPAAGGLQDPSDMAGAIVEMDVSIAALAAVLTAMRASSDMLVAAIDSGGYGARVDQ